MQCAEILACRLAKIGGPVRGRSVAPVKPTLARLGPPSTAGRVAHDTMRQSNACRRPRNSAFADVCASL